VSTAVGFLLVAIAAAIIGSAIIWAIQHRPTRRPPDFQEQLRAIAPRPGLAEQPTGIVHLDPADDEER